MAELVAEEYESSLADLNCNSKPLINMLTILAEENEQHAPCIVQAVEKHLLKVRPEIKLPVLYLIDSIVKNIGSTYCNLFTQNIVSTFCSVFEKVDEKTRASMFKLRQTWNDVFPAKKLYAIDVRVNSMDPAWPITAPPPASIHVNPKFFKSQSPEPDKLSSTNSTSIPDSSHGSTMNSNELSCNSISNDPSCSATSIPNEQSELEIREVLLTKHLELKELQIQKAQIELKAASIENNVPENEKKQIFLQKQKELMELKSKKLEAELELLTIQNMKKNEKLTEHSEKNLGIMATLVDCEKKSFLKDTDLRAPRDPRISKNKENDGKSKDRMPKHLARENRLGNKIVKNKDDATKDKKDQDSNSKRVTFESSIMCDDFELGNKSKDKFNQTSVNKLLKKAETNKNKIDFSKQSALPKSESKNIDILRNTKSDGSIRKKLDFPNRNKGIKSQNSKRPLEEHESMNPRESPKKEEFKVKKLIPRDGDSKISAKPTPIPKTEIDVGIPKPDTKKSPDMCNYERIRFQDLPRIPLKSQRQSCQIPRAPDPETVTDVPLDKIERKGLPKFRGAKSVRGRNLRPHDSDDNSEGEPFISDEHPLFGNSEEHSLSPSPPLKRGRLSPNKENQDVDLRPPLFPSPEHRKRKGDGTDGTSHCKKSKEEVFDELFGKEDVDLRQGLQDKESSWAKFKETHPDTYRTPLRSPYANIPKMKDSRFLNHHDGMPTMEGKDIDMRPPLLPTPPMREVFHRGRGRGRGRGGGGRGRFPKENVKFDRLGRPLLFGPLPDDPFERRVSLSQKTTPSSASFCPQLSRTKSFSNSLDITEILAQAEEQMACGVLSVAQYNMLLEQVKQFQELQVLREAEERGMSSSAIGEEFDWKYPSNSSGLLAPGDIGTGPIIVNSEHRDGRYDNGFADVQGNTEGMSLAKNESRDIDERLLGSIPHVMSETGHLPIQSKSENQTMYPSSLSDQLYVSDMAKSLQIDGIERYIRFYNENAIVFMDWDDPRDLIFEETVRTVIIDESHRCTCVLGDDYREFNIDGRMHQIKLGVPTKELYIDGIGYECFFGGEAIRVDIDSKQHTIRLEGPPPIVKIGEKKRCDLVLARSKIVVDAKDTFTIFLDSLIQHIKIDNQPVTLQFADNFKTLLVGGKPYFNLDYGGQPLSVVLKGAKHYLKLPILPAGCVPGQIYISGMLKGEGSMGSLPSVPASQTMKMSHSPAVSESHSLHLPAMPIIGNRAPPPHEREKRANKSKRSRSPQTPMPTVNHPPEAVTKPAEVLDVSQLYERLIASGLLPSKPATESEKPEDPEKDMDFSLECLRLKCPPIISALYRGIQCSACGVRFPPEQAELYAPHLDWHFRQNKRDKDCARKAQSRKWYYDVSDWIQFEEIEDLEERAQSWFEQQQAQEKEVEKDTELMSVVISKHEEENTCCVCYETFEQFYHKDLEEWHLREAMRADGKTYHPSCYEDSQTSTVLVNDISMEENPDGASETPGECADDNLLHQLVADSQKEVIEDPCENSHPEEEHLDVPDEMVIEPSPKIELCDEDALVDINPANLVTELEESDTLSPVKEELDCPIKLEATDDLPTGIEGFKEPDPDPMPEETNDSVEKDIEPSPDTGGHSDVISGEFVKELVANVNLPFAPCSIDGNEQLSSSSSAMPTVPNKIKINLSAPIRSEPSPDKSKSIREDNSETRYSDEPNDIEDASDEAPIKLSIDPINKPRLVGKKLTELPPKFKGKELSGLCSIM